MYLSSIVTDVKPLYSSEVIISYFMYSCGVIIEEKSRIKSLCCIYNISMDNRDRVIN